MYNVLHERHKSSAVWPNKPGDVTNGYSQTVSASVDSILTLLPDFVHKNKKYSLGAGDRYLGSLH